MNDIRSFNSASRFFKFPLNFQDAGQFFSFLPLLLLFSIVFVIAPEARAQIRAAVVKKDITPTDSQYLMGYGERKSTGVMDKIYHRILAIDGGTTRFFIVSTEICLYAPSEYDKVAATLQKKYGINPLNVWWSCRIGLLRLDKEDGTSLALIANYAMHGTVMGPANLEISGDAPGIVSEYVEKKIGAPVLYINGAAGNMAPIYSVYPSAAAGHLSQFQVLLGNKIVEANKKISTSIDTIRLTAGSLTVETPRKIGMAWTPDLAKYSSTTKEGVNMVKLPVRFLKINDDIAIWSAPIEGCHRRFCSEYFWDFPCSCGKGGYYSRQS